MVETNRSSDPAAKPLPSLEEYSPASPPKSARRWGLLLRQASRLPATLSTICKLVGEDLSTAALDEHLWAFWGFHNQPADPYYRARPWSKVRLAAIGPGNVRGLPVWEMALMMNVAMEIEEPIQEYSRQNGEGFRLLLPALGRFLGQNREQAAYAAEHHLPWCESPWCEEERRHANAFARMIERLTHTSPGRQNPNRPRIATAEEADALRLVISREAAEWNSSSTYIVMAAHATGDLRDLIRNVAQDEIKHLGILSAADLYLFGPRGWKRFAALVNQSLQEYAGHKHERSGGEFMGTNPITALEVILCHLLTQRRIRKWLTSLPLFTLESIFEIETHANPPPQLAVQCEEVRRSRAGLVRWEPGPRQRALRERSFEMTHAGAIARPASRSEKRMLRACLRNRLRDDQIRHNRHVPRNEIQEPETTK